MNNNRRDFLKIVEAGAVSAALPQYTRAQEKEKAGKTVAQTVLPRWRGFNLLDMFTMRSRGDFREDDFRE